MDCPSCYEYFDAADRIPRNLNCGHTFCEQCLIKIEQQRLTVCPICRATIAKPFKPKKLPKNFIALDYAQRQHEMLKKSNFCSQHPKELMKHFCNTCMRLICVDCIVDHSGHSFVKKEESVYVLKENGQQIVRQLEKNSQRTVDLINNGDQMFRQMKLRRIKDMKMIDAKYQRLIDKIQGQRAQIKIRYNDCFSIEEKRINQEVEIFEKHLDLINYNKETVRKAVEELESGPAEKINGGSEVSSKIDYLKNIQDDLNEQTARLQDIQISFPQVQISMDGFDRIDKELEHLIKINHNKYLMSDKKIAFFGDTNKVMLLDLKNFEWTIKTINNNSNSNRNLGGNGGQGAQNLDFMYYAAAVTLPNGDALITGGGSSTTVYQYINSKCEIVMRSSMNQMRKEHAAVINGPFVYVMGGYDGNQNIFLNCCEYYDIHKNQWKFFAPMNISKCAFSATIVNKEYIYTFGGYDGQQRLDAIERYHIKDGSWELLNIKLKFPLSNCACFCPQKNKVIVFGGGFSSGFSPFVEQIDVVTQQWESLPIMSEGRDLRNKVCYVEGSAYAMGGLNSKAERLNYFEKKWNEVPCYPLSDNLDSWASCLLFTPKLFSNKQASNQEGLQILNQAVTPKPAGATASGAPGNSDLNAQRREQSLENAPANGEGAGPREDNQHKDKNRELNRQKISQQKLSELMQLEKQIDNMIDEEIEGDKYTEEMVNFLRQNNFEQQIPELEPQDSPQSNANSQMNIVTSLTALEGAAQSQMANSAFMRQDFDNQSFNLNINSIYDWQNLENDFANQFGFDHDDMFANGEVSQQSNVVGAQAENMAQMQHLMGQQPPHSGQTMQNQSTGAQRNIGNIGINIAQSQSNSGQHLGRNQSQGLTLNSGRGGSSGYNIAQRIGVDSTTNQNRPGHGNNTSSHARGIRRTNNLNSTSSSNQNSQARDLRARNGAGRQQQINDHMGGQSINQNDLESVVPRHSVQSGNNRNQERRSLYGSGVPGHHGSSANRGGGNLGGQNIANAQSFDPGESMDEVRRQSNERDRNGSRPTVSNDEHHGINLASIGEDNNYEENMSNGPDEVDMANSEQVEDNHGNLRDNEGGGVQHSPSHQADDNLSEDEFDECEGSQATNSNIGVSQNDNINLASEDQPISNSQQNMGQRVIERRQHYGGHPRAALNRGYNQSSVPVPSSGGSGGASNQNSSSANNGPTTSSGRHQFGSGSMGQNQGRPSYLQGTSNYIASSGNHMSSGGYPSRAGGMLTSPNAGHGPRQQMHGGSHRQGNLLMGSGSTGTSAINQQEPGNTLASASRASASQQQPPSNLMSSSQHLNQGQSQNQTNYNY